MWTNAFSIPPRLPLLLKILESISKIDLDDVVLQVDTGRARHKGGLLSWRGRTGIEIFVEVVQAHAIPGSHAYSHKWVHLGADAIAIVEPVIIAQEAARRR